MSRDPHPFYAPISAFSPEGIVRFPGEEAKHILRVTRLRPGDSVRVVDGQGGTHQVLLAEEDEAGLTGRVIESRREAPPAVPLEAGFPLLHLRARTEWMLEKAVEVGADRLVPVLWQRGLPRAETLAEATRNRWERILREAMKQSERSWLPALGEPEPPGKGEEGTILVLADPGGEEALPDLRGARSVRLLVGPEGGLTDEEQARLREAGAKRLALGGARLRSETAAIVGLSLLARALRSAGGESR